VNPHEVKRDNVHTAGASVRVISNSGMDLLKSSGRKCRVAIVIAACCTALVPLGNAEAQNADTSILRVDLPSGRSYAITTPSNITQVSVASPDIADVIVMGSRDVVINGHANGESDVIV